MSENKTNINMAIYSRDPKEQWFINDLDIGSLMNELTRQPRNLNEAGESGVIKFHVQRTHEWELVIGLVLAGSAIFIKGVLSELGKKFAEWLVEEVGKLDSKKKPEVRAPGVARVVIDSAHLDGSSVAILELINKAAEKGIQIQLVVEPG